MMVDEIHLNKTRLALFNTTAPRYHLIMLAFGPLAERLVKVAALQPDETVIDLGTGIGAAAFPAGQVVRQVVGLDYAPAMLPRARQHSITANFKNVSFYQGNMHCLPHQSESFTVALASLRLQWH